MSPNPFAHCGLRMWQEWDDAHRYDKENLMQHPDRQPVYDALDALPAPVFAALLYALSGVNRVLALTAMDDPTPNGTLDAAIKPFMETLEG